MAEVFESGKEIIIIPEVPNQIRFNRQKGVIAVGNLKTKEDEKLNPRGTWISGLIVNVELNLHGIIGQARAKDWIHVHLLCSDAEDERLERGKVYSFVMTGIESTKFGEDFDKLDGSIKVERIKAKAKGQTLDMTKFVRSVKIVMPEIPTPVGEGNEKGDYYYPILTFDWVAEEDKDLAKAVIEIREKYFHLLYSAESIFKPSFDEFGQLISGLMPADESSSQAVLEGTDEVRMLTSA